MIRRKTAIEDFQTDFEADDEFTTPAAEAGAPVEAQPHPSSEHVEAVDAAAAFDHAAEPGQRMAEWPPETDAASATGLEAPEGPEAPDRASPAAQPSLGPYERVELTPALEGGPSVDASDSFASLRRLSQPHAQAIEPHAAATAEPEADSSEAVELAPSTWTETVETDPFVDAPDPFAGLRGTSEPAPSGEVPDFHSASGFSAIQEAYGAVEAEPGAGSGPVSAYAPEPLPAVSSSLLDSDAEAFSSGAIAPRIAIHIFTERPDTAEIAERVSADRRMSRATTTVRPGGLSAALGAYGLVPTPPLLIVESHEPPDTLIAGLDRLAEACDPGTKVVVIGKANDIALYRELMNRGVSEYLVAPLGPLQLIHAITTLYSDPDTAFVGRTIAFVGSKGGVGSSTLAHNFAYGLSEHVQAATCIVDYDLPFGTAGLDFNQDPVQGLHDALQNPERVDSTLLDRMAARCSDRLSLFAAPASLDEDWDISAAAYDEVGQKLRGAAPYLVLDLPHLWSAWMRSTLIAADDVVLVASPDLASLRNGKNLLDLLKRGRQNDKPPMLVLNQVGLPGRPEIPVKEFTKAMGIEPALVLPFDAKLFGQAANNGQMLFEVNAKAKASEGLLQFVQQVSRRELIAPKPKGLIERLTGRG